MDNNELEFYKKLNKYYEERDELYSFDNRRYSTLCLGAFIGHILLGFLSLIIVTMFIVEIGMHPILIIMVLMIILFTVLGCAFVIKNRKKRLKKLHDREEELLYMINNVNTFSCDAKLNLNDYIREFENLGFIVRKEEDNQTIRYELFGLKKKIVIVSKHSFFLEKLNCYIDECDFKKYSKDYKSESLRFNYYQALWIFYRYINENINDFI